MGYRINERNTGTWSLGAEPKNVRSKKVGEMTESDKELLIAVIERVIDAMEFDPQISDRGHLDEDAKFTDVVQFTLFLSMQQFQRFVDIKLKIDK